jgi:hypothetical protein
MVENTDQAIAKCKPTQMEGRLHRGSIFMEGKEKVPMNG